MKKIIIALVLLSMLTTVTAQKERIDDPVRNFEELWSEFDLRYANFVLKEVDWAAIYDTYRPMVTEQTTNGQLFQAVIATTLTNYGFAEPVRCRTTGIPYFTVS